jgi:predicted transcriptional regulator
VTPPYRKAVLLRFEPELLERLDHVSGEMKRHEWLMAVIERAVFRAEAVEGAMEAAPASGEVFDEDGIALGLRASRREDGVLEISAVDPAPDSPQETGLDGGSAEPPGRVTADAEGPDIGSATLVEE